MHEAANSRHCGHDTDHDQSEAPRLPLEQIHMKILPDIFLEQADEGGNCQIGYKFSEKHLVRFWSLFVLGHFNMWLLCVIKH